MPRFEAPTTREAIALAVRGMNAAAQAPALKQNNNLSMSEGFGRVRFGDQFTGTGEIVGENFEQAKRRVGQRFEELARQYYPNQARAFDRSEFDEVNMIPELSTQINYIEGRDGSVRYQYSDIYAGRYIPNRRHGQSPLPYRRTSVAIIHAHWIDSSPSSTEGMGRMESIRVGDLDVEAARRIRDDIGDRVRFFIYKWNQTWGAY